MHNYIWLCTVVESKKKKKIYFRFIIIIIIFLFLFLLSYLYLNSQLSTSHLSVSLPPAHPKLNVTGPRPWPTPSNQAVDPRCRPLAIDPFRVAWLGFFFFFFPLMWTSGGGGSGGCGYGWWWKWLWLVDEVCGGCFYHYSNKLFVLF